MLAQSTFRTAIPYAAGTLAVGAAGACIALTATSTAAVVAGIALALFGTYAFFGVIACGLEHSGNPSGFQANVGKFVITAAGSAIAEIISTVAKVVLIDLIHSALGSKRHA